MDPKAQKKANLQRGPPDRFLGKAGTSLTPKTAKGPDRSESPLVISFRPTRHKDSAASPWPQVRYRHPHSATLDRHFLHAAMSARQLDHVPGPRALAIPRSNKRVSIFSQGAIHSSLVRLVEKGACLQSFLRHAFSLPRTMCIETHKAIADDSGIGEMPPRKRTAPQTQAECAGNQRLVSYVIPLKVRSQRGLNGLEFGLLKQWKEAMSFIRRDAVDDLCRVEVNQLISVQNEA
jgi:hypothetical protein